MRRALFKEAIVLGGESAVKASISEALLFDLRSAESPDDEGLAEQRVATFDYAALLMGATHLICGVACIILHPTSDLAAMSGALALLAFTLCLDGAAATALHMRDRWNLAPHTITRSFCAYLAVSGMMWMLFASAMPHSFHQASADLLSLSLGVGITVTAIVAIGSPSASLVNAVMAVAAAAMFAGAHTLTGGVAALATVTVAYSVAGARTMLAAARQRLHLDAQARKALRFVHEFENSGRGWFWETNNQGTLSYVSQQLADDFKCQPEALLGRQFNDLLSIGTSTGDNLREERTLGFHLSARFPFSDVVVRAASDEDVHWSLSGNPIFDERGRFLGFRGIGTDLTEQRRSEEEISRLARFDSLTGLPNRALMRKTLDEALRNAARRQKGCSLFLIDLDRFKNVNDTLGHPIGDALLRQVAQRLTSGMGNHGQIGRLGGDEFMAVLPGTVEAGLLESLSKTLIELVSRPYSIESHKVTIGASVGIAIGDPGRSCADSLVRNADLALYAAKAAGRGRHSFYESSMHSEASDRQVLENDLRQAIERNELSVAYQPIVRAAGEEVCGFEALVRWAHPVRGPISPEKFIPLAEECGMIGPIGTWVLKTALAEAARWPDHIRIAVNLSPIQFNDPEIISIVREALKESGVRSERLELEITEGVFLADGDETDVTFARLKALGVRLALDDFGTGYSSLGYLKKAPFDKIKIDQSFVKGAASSMNRNSAIIRAIVTLAESLGMDTTAEGVETHDDLQLVRELGVSQIQGYIFGRPGNAESALVLATSVSVEAEGFQCVREKRQRLMRRAIAGIDGVAVEVRLRNISAMGALVETDRAVAPGTQVTLDIVGVGPMVGLVRWSQAGKFGLQFTENFEIARLAPPKRRDPVRPWYVGAPEKAAG